MITLAIETSTSQGSVALLDGPTTLFSEVFTAARGHGSAVFESLQRAVHLARPQQIAVGLGPGSYSGVRIAISAAVGLSLGTGAALVGIASVAAFAEAEYLAVGDARRGLFYFTHVRDGALREGPWLLDRAGIDRRLAESALPVFASEPLDLERVEMRHPTAGQIANLALADRSVIARDHLEPIYLRDPHITAPKSAPPFLSS